MSRYYNNTDYSGFRGLSKHPRRKGLLILKICLWALFAIVVVSACVFWGLTAYFSPNRITRIIEEESGKYLRADIKIGSLDYKLWTTYPWLAFEVDSLSVVSRSLDGISSEIRQQLPAYADSLASVVRVKGKINLHSLFHKELKLKDIEVDRPCVNIVMVDDSISNFNIAPSFKSDLKIKNVDISEVNVSSPVDFSFFSLKDDAEARLGVESFFLTREDKTYKIGFDGEVSGRLYEYSLPGNLPVKFSTSVIPDVGNLTLDLNDLTFSLAGINFDAKGKIKVKPQKIDFEDARLILSSEDLFATISSLPEKIASLVELPEGLKGLLPLGVEVKILQPLSMPLPFPEQISLNDLPPIEAFVRIEGANLELTPPHQKRIKADDISLLAKCSFDPENPQNTFLEIEDFHIHGEGITLSATASVSNITGEQQQFNGHIRLQSPVMETLTYFMPHSGVKVSGFLRGNTEFSGSAVNMGREGLKDIRVKGDITSHSVSLKMPSLGSFRLKNMEADYQAVLPEYPLNNYKGTKLGLEFKADSVGGKSSGVEFLAGGLDMKLDALDSISGTPDPSGTFYLRTQCVSVTTGSAFFFADNIMANASGNLNPSGTSSNYTTVSPTAGANDALIAKRTPHTPLLLEYSGGGILPTIIGMVDINADINIGRGGLRSNAYLYPVDFSGISLSTNLNRVKFSASEFQAGNSGVSINGDIEGLAPFLTSYNATPLKARAILDFSNVDINELSWGYYGAQLAQGRDSVFYVAPMLPLTASDSIIVAIPRNIDANINLHANSAQYMGYRFNPLSTSIIVKDGEATLEKLTIGAPYCSVTVDWTYSTSRLSDIFMNLDAKVENFSLTPFYHTFPQLLQKAPELQNLTGKISADISCHFDMFPTMFMNPESLRAKFDLKASDMEFVRKGKIERITHLMLIEGEQPIQIENMDISGAFHDNLLQLNPFKIAFENYQLGVAGVNNTAGMMYYHLALEKSPFHLPFGVSLYGKFGHPVVKLGGTHIDDYRAEMVSMDNQPKLDINIMAYLHHGWILFVEEAAKYQQKLTLSPGKR